MRLPAPTFVLLTSLLLSACICRGPNPNDPYEAINRKTYAFNMAFDATVLKPPAKFYKAVVPVKVRVGVNNVYNNVNLIPTVANDLLQADWRYAIKDSWRFIINSTIGVAGIFDPAAGWSLPPHTNDLGITFAKWGDKKSPYVVIPFLGPSTIRDGMGLLFEYTYLTPYPYINAVELYPIIALRYVDVRSQFLDTERLLEQALDKYAFIRDAYLQNRNYLITGTKDEEETGSLYIDEPEEGAIDYLDDEAAPVVSENSKITPSGKINAAPSAV